MVGDAVNVLLATAAYNFKKAMKALWYMLHNNVSYIILHVIF